jgi:hypothetical protein
LNTKPPDVCRFVFVCAFADWQVQAAPRVRSDLGGAIETFKAIAEAHRAHMFEDHADADRETMRRVLVRMGAPDEVTRRQGDGHLSGAMAGVPLPLWWVDR